MEYERPNKDFDKKSVVEYNLTNSGFIVKIDDKEFEEFFPEDIWSEMPDSSKRIVAENYIACATYSLPLMNGKMSIEYGFPSPILDSFFLVPVLNYIPTISNGESYFEMYKKILNSVREFSNGESGKISMKEKNSGRAVCFMTFGKDSMLSYALSEELGLNPIALYIEEPDIKYKDTDKEENQDEMMYENLHKNRLISLFKEEFDKKVYSVNNGLGKIRYPDEFNKIGGDYGWATNLTEYSLLSLPFVYNSDAGYVVFGNESSCSTPFVNEDRILTYPVFEQSKVWTIENSKMLNILSHDVKAISLIEPLNEIAIIKILFHRYPKYAKYLMSCFADNNNAKESRWCYHCSKCARIYAFLVANGIDPKIVDFNENMFLKKKEGLFSLFGFEKGGEIKVFDRSGLGRDEILFAFYLAYKRGVKGYLIDKFADNFLKEAESRLDELKERFFGIHSFDTIPEKFHAKLKKIFEEELYDIFN